jgi:hypothetical protein
METDVKRASSTTGPTFFEFNAHPVEESEFHLVFKTDDVSPAVIQVSKKDVRQKNDAFYLQIDAEVQTFEPPATVTGTPESDDSCPGGRTQCAGNIKFCCGSRVIGNCNGAWSCADCN